MAVLCDLPPEILRIIVDILLTDGNARLALRQKLKYRALLPLGSCSWYYRRFCLECGLFWRINSSLQSPSSGTGRLLRNFGPQPVSLVVDLGAPDTWALCESVLKAFPNVEEIGLVQRRRADDSPLDMDMLSSQLCLSEFQGTRLTLMNAWLSYKDLVLLERLKSWRNVTTISVFQSGLIREEGQLPSRFFGSVFPKLGKLVVCYGNTELASGKSHGLYRLVELILISSTCISQFEISSGVSTEGEDAQAEVSRKLKGDLLKLLRVNHTRDSLTSLVDEDGVQSEASFLDFLGKYYAATFGDQPFQKMTFFSFRLAEPLMENLAEWLWSAIIYFGKKLECILVETTYKDGVERDRPVEGAVLLGPLLYRGLAPVGKLRIMKLLIGNPRDGYLFYNLGIVWTGVLKVFQRGHLSEAQCRKEVEKYQNFPSRRYSKRLQSGKMIRVELDETIAPQP
jgi:hypothetical protein